MRQLVLSLLCSLAICGYARAQYTIKGTVTDTLNVTKLHYASAVLIRSSDSVIENFTRSDENGNIQLHASKEGKYVLRISFPTFADYVDEVTISKPVTDLGELPMVSKQHLLQEFVITKQYAAIKIKGDTTEYMADSFKTKENATVEDLLKKLPGIQVDKNGQITAQGETVAKVLVDGEEFFSDDPKVVTKGLQANAVDKVQVFDKKSDQAEFTGIDDGQKTKTINLELKDDKKKGYFGKVDAGGGTDGYFQDQAMINAFKAKRQISAFGIMSNTDKVGLGWQDNDKYSSGNGTTEITEDGGIMTTYTSDGSDFSGWDGKYNGEGLPKVWTGGLHYADKWNSDKDHITVNARTAQQDVEIDGNSIMDNTNAGLTQNTTKHQFSKGTRNALDASFDVKLDSTSTLKVSIDGGTKQMDTRSLYTTTSQMAGFDTSSYNNRTITSSTQGQFLNADLLYRKKFAKKGRTLSIDVKENEKSNSSSGYLNSTVSPMVGDTTLPGATTDQKKDNSSTSLKFSGKAVYTEPLVKDKVFMEAQYATVIDNSTAKNLSYDAPGSYETVDSIYSSNYKFNVLTNKGGLNFKYNTKKIQVSAGADVADTKFDGNNLFRSDSGISREYLNLLPSLSFVYKLSKQTSLRVFVDREATAPSISQIQPLLQNTDPLNITIGNPKLTQEYNNSLNINFNDYKVLTGRYIWLSGRFHNAENDISTSQHIYDGITTTQYVNVNGDYGANFYGGGGVKLKKTNAFVGLQLNSNISHMHNYVNDTLNTSNNNSYSIQPYINYEKENKYEFNFNPSFTYNDNNSSISHLSTNYYVFNIDFSGSYQLPKKFEVGSSVYVMIRQQTSVFNTNNNVVKWNAYIGKKFLKKSQLEARISVFDILNQNIGFSRNASNGIITQDSYSTIRRYGLLNLIWNFSHTPAGAPQPTGQMMIIK